MYLLPAGAAARNNRKLTGLGRYRLRPQFAGLPGAGSTWSPRLRRLRGLGDAQDPNAIDPLTGETYADESVPGSQAAWKLYQAINQANAAITPTPPATQPVLPNIIPNPLTNLQTGMTISQNPLDYVSPQAAIAAGLNSQVVYDAWAKGLSRFPTQQAAIAAGIPAGVITQLWQQSRSTPAPTSFLDKTFLGVPVKYLLGAGGGLFLLTALSHGGRR